MKKISKIFILDKPNFYKINLLNRVSEKIKIKVIYTNNEKIKRDNYFYAGDPEFESMVLEGGVLKKIFVIIEQMNKIPEAEIVVNGYNDLVMIAALLLRKSSMILESTIQDNKKSKIIREALLLIKKLILLRVCKFYCVGIEHSNYAKKLNNNAKIIITNTVGFPFIKKEKLSNESKNRNNFLYIGRNSPEKNLNFLVANFSKINRMKGEMLHMAGDNFNQYASCKYVKVIGMVERIQIPQTLSSYRGLFLLSTSEPYGLVVEEAIRCGTPVIISKDCGITGCFDIELKYGVILKEVKPEEFDSAMDRFFKNEKEIINNIKKIEFEQRDYDSVGKYAN